MLNFKNYFILLLSILNFQTSAQSSLDYSELGKKIELEESFKSTLEPFLEKMDSKVIDSKLFPENDKFTISVLEEISYYEKKGIDSTKKLIRKLINFHPLGNKKYSVQLASYAIDAQGEQLLLLWTLLTHKSSNGYSFSSPVDYNTNHWKTKQVGKIIYHFRDSINMDRANLFAQKNIDFSKKFNIPEQSFHFYMTNNYQEILKLVGIDYCKVTIGRVRDGWGVVADAYIFSVMNNEDFSHDLFHYYSGTIHESKIRNWVVEEGIAYSWGNAYYTQKSGEMADQTILVGLLKSYLKENPSTNLYELFRNNFWTDKSGIFEELAPDFSVGRLMSSLICDAIEEKHGMTGINELISCGNEPDRFTAYFKATQNLIGLNSKNFNAKVRTFIENY